MELIIIVCSVVVIAVLVLVAIVIIRALAFRSKQMPIGEKISYPVNKDEAAARLAGAIRFKTVSNQDKSQADASAFLGFHEFLKKAFPLIHSNLERKVINDYGLLFTWKGSDAAMKPVLLMAHQDVVPATDENWKYPPFAGAIEEGYIWGRGAMDDKGSLMAIMEAVEFLLKEGYRPSRSICIANGSDEEVGGYQGANKIAEYLREQGVRFEYVIDEGMLATMGTTPGIAGWTALVGIAEKGHLSLELSTEQKGGHSMSPPQQTSVGVLAAAIVKLQDNPFPLRLTPATTGMLEYLGSEMRFRMKLLMANMWLFAPLVTKRMAGTPMEAALRTTTAPTMFSGSPQDNVLPMQSSAVVNFRILQGDSVQSVTDRVAHVADDPRIKIASFGTSISEPSPVSPLDNRAFAVINRTIREVMGDVLVIPALVLGGTDSVFFRDLAECIYRFWPARLPAEEISSLHGFNERISVDNYAEVINFYIRLLHNSCD